MHFPKAGNLQNVSTQDTASAANPKKQASKKSARRDESLLDLLVRKMPHGFLFDTPVPSPCEGMLRRSSFGTQSSSSAPPSPSSAPTSPETSAQSSTGAAARLASLLAFGGHAETAAGLGNAPSRSEQD